VVIYPASGETTLGILRSLFDGSGAPPVAFSTLDGEHFAVPRRDIAALHLAARDEEQT
jgi:hypothetical protein